MPRIYLPMRNHL